MGQKIQIYHMHAISSCPSSYARTNLADVVLETSTYIQ